MLARIVFVVAAFAAVRASAAVVYTIDSIPLSDGHEIGGGTITTDGTVGLLLTDNILDYEIRTTFFVNPFLMVEADFGSGNSTLQTGIDTPFITGGPLFATADGRLEFRRQTNPDFVFDVRFSSQSDNTSLRFQFDELRLFGDFGRGREGTLTVPTAVTFARIAAVPEPGTLLLAGVGAACLARRRRG